MYFVIVNPQFGKTKPEPFTNYGRALAKYRELAKQAWVTALMLVVDLVNGEPTSRVVLKGEGSVWRTLMSK